MAKGTRSGATYGPPDPPSEESSNSPSPPRSPSPPPPAVGPLPFDPDNFTSSLIQRTSFGRARIAWDFLVNAVGKWPDPKWIQFIFSDPVLDDHDRPSSADWIPLWPLGRGGFGYVGLWARMNRFGDPYEQTAIKETGEMNHHLYKVGLSREAVIQGHLTAMRAGEDVIAQLKGYKFFPHPTDTFGDKARLYLEYAPFETLEQLKRRYRAFNQYLPELFLWKVFLDLAKANNLLSDCPATWNPVPPANNDDTPEGFEQDAGRFILHRDMKPANFLIGSTQEPEIDEDEADPELLYPNIRMTDFGMAVPKDSQAIGRRRSIIGLGTVCYMAPEQLDYSTNWVGDDLYGHRNRTFRFSAALNTFGVGRTMWSMMSLNHDADWPGPVDDRGDLRADLTNIADEQAFSANNSHFIANGAASLRPPGSNYSITLLQLIYDCISPVLNIRPSANALLHRAQSGYQNAVIASNMRIRQNTAGIDDYKVSFDNADMNSKEVGTGPFLPRLENGHDERLFGDVRGLGPVELGNPDAPFLEPPRQLWEPFYAVEEDLRRKLLRDHEDAEPDAHVQKGIREVLADDRLVQKVGDWAHFGQKGGDVSVPPPRRKRANSWDSAEEENVSIRRALRSIHNQTTQYTSGKPIALLEYVYVNEKHNINNAVRVLRWLYSNGRLQPPWTRTTHNKDMARRLVQDWKRKFPTRAERSFRECLYFVSKQTGGPLRNQLALSTMDQIFRPEEDDVDIEEAAPDAQFVQQQQLVRQLRLKIDHLSHTTEEPIYLLIRDGRLRNVLEFCAWDVDRAFNHLNKKRDFLHNMSMLEAAAVMDREVVDTWDVFGMPAREGRHRARRLRAFLNEKIVQGSAFFRLNPRCAYRALQRYSWNHEAAHDYVLRGARRAGYTLVDAEGEDEDLSQDGDQDQNDDDDDGNGEGPDESGHDNGSRPDQNHVQNAVMEHPQGQNNHQHIDPGRAQQAPALLQDGAVGRPFPFGNRAPVPNPRNETQNDENDENDDGQANEPGLFVSPPGGPADIDWG